MLAKWTTALTDIEGEGVGTQRIIQHRDSEREDGRRAEAVDRLCHDKHAEIARQRRCPSFGRIRVRLHGRTPRHVVAVRLTHGVHRESRLGQVQRRREVGQAEEQAATGEADEPDPDSPRPVDSATRWVSYVGVVANNPIVAIWYLNSLPKL